MVAPFVWIRGRLYVVANWTDRMPEGAWLLVRPATGEENDNYLERVSAAVEETFWTSVLIDEDRLSGGRGPRRRGSGRAG
jgi:hypothetical protein